MGLLYFSTFQNKNNIWQGFYKNGADFVFSDGCFPDKLRRILNNRHLKLFLVAFM